MVTRGGGFEFTCKGFAEPAALVKEVEGLRQMVEDMMEKVAGLRCEDKGAETGRRVTMTGVRTEERKEISFGTSLMATHPYMKKPESLLGKGIDPRQWDTLVFKGEHIENEHGWLVEYGNGQIGYAPVAFLVVILDTTVEEEESDATKKGQENSTEENWIRGGIGPEGERRKRYSAAVIDEFCLPEQR